MSMQCGLWSTETLTSWVEWRRR